MKAVIYSFVSFVLAFIPSTSSNAQWLQSVTADKDSYSVPGEVITFTYVFDSGPTQFSSLAFKSLIPGLGVSCPALPAGTNATVTCTASYTVTRADCAQNGVIVDQPYYVQNGHNIGNYAGQVRIAYSAPNPDDPVVEFKGIQLTPDGNFGIGITSPTKRLQVNGDALVSGTISGGGYSGGWGTSALINGYDVAGGSARFILSFEKSSAADESGTIKINNVDADTFKTFVIDHPLSVDRYLVHATLEGPEGAVFYRGEARLENGQATIALPDYFEALTRPGGRTVQLTPVGGFDPLAVKVSQDGAVIENGRFHVHSSVENSRQRFFWEVKAVRADKPVLDDEPSKERVLLNSFGPYRFLSKHARK